MNMSPVESRTTKLRLPRGRLSASAGLSVPPKCSVRPRGCGAGSSARTQSPPHVAGIGSVGQPSFNFARLNRSHGASLAACAFVFFAAASASGQSAISLAPPAGPIPATYFGMHNHEPLDSNRRVSIDIGTYRLWDVDVNWPNLEPQKGQWRWTRLDAVVSLAEQRGWQVIIPLAFSPRWGSARPNEDAFSDSARLGWSAEPANMDDWRNYVRTVAARYRGRAHIYEVWNEPNNRNFFTGTTAQLVALAREAYAAIKLVDPSAIVVSPAAAHNAGTGLAYLDRYLALGGGSYADVIGYHFYIDAEPPERLPVHIASVRQIMTRYELGGKPLWNTEASWAAGQIRFSSDDEQSAWLARAYVLNWAAGVEQFDWYAWDNRVYPSIYMLQADLRTPAKPAAAYAQIRRWLLGARMAAAGADASGTWTVKLNRPDNTIAYVVWNPNRSLSMTIPPAWRATRLVDVYGQERALTASPIQVGAFPLLIETTAPAYAQEFAGAVSAAAIADGPLAPGSLVTIFAEPLRATPQSAQYLPWFETLGSATVHVSDTSGSNSLARITYLGPGQVNLLLPDRLQAGSGKLTAIADDGVAYSAPIRIARVAPALFTANADGRGAPAAYAVIVDGIGNQSIQYAFQCGSEPGKCRPAALPVSGAGRAVVLVLYGTGLRAATLDGVAVNLCGQTLRPAYAGPQGVYPGLDQVNVALPASIRNCGAADLILMAAGVAANPVSMIIE